jgi:hypothetical protein
VKIIGATKIKWAAVSTLILLAFVLQTFAVLRPPFPAKPAAPFDGDLIIIGDDLILECTKTPAASTELGCAINARKECYSLCPEGCPSVGNAP